MTALWGTNFLNVLGIDLAQIKVIGDLLMQ